LAQNASDAVQRGQGFLREGETILARGGGGGGGWAELASNISLEMSKKRKGRKE